MLIRVFLGGQGMFTFLSACNCADCPPSQHEHNSFKKKPGIQNFFLIFLQVPPKTIHDHYYENALAGCQHQNYITRFGFRIMGYVFRRPSWIHRNRDTVIRPGLISREPVLSTRADNADRCRPEYWRGGADYAVQRWEGGYQGGYAFLSSFQNIVR